MSVDSSQVAQFVLRKALFEMHDGSKNIDQVTESALSHLSNLVQWRCSSDKQIPVMNAQQAVVTGALAAAKKFYEVYTEQNQQVGRKRLNFDKEVKSGVANMLVRQNVESRAYKDEEKVFIDFLELFSGLKESTIQPYLGLKSSKVREDSIDVDGDFYSVMPFFSMSYLVEQPLVSDIPSASVCRAISLFFKTQLPEYLGEIKEEFNRRWRIFDLIRSLRQGQNFLNDLRIRRFIIVSLGNLLWSLQYPVNPETGKELSGKKKIELCREAKKVINRLLDRNHPPNISILGQQDSLITYIRTIELYLTELSDSFEKDELQSLDMNAVTSSAQTTAEILDENIFKLIYNGHSTAKYLASQINSLNILLKKNSTILSHFPADGIVSEELNHPPKTLVDVLIIFSNLQASERESIINNLNNSKFSSRITFAQILKKISERYIEPIEKAYLNAIQTERVEGRKQDVNKVVAQRFLPLVALVVLDHRCQVDTEESLRSKRIAERNSDTFHAGKEQIEIISRIAFETQRPVANRYTWDLSLYLQLSKKLIELINKLPRRQYKLGQFTTLLDALKSFIGQYKTFLLYPKFKAFVIESLDLVSREFLSLKATLDELDNKIKADRNEDRRLVDTIITMDQNLMSEIEDFKSSVDNLSEKVNSTEFEDNLKEDIISRLSELKNKFALAFGRSQTGMESILEEASPILKRKTMMGSRGGVDSSLESEKGESHCNDTEKLSLNNLINQCLYNMSSRSIEGKKGQLLRQLRDDYSLKKKCITKKDIQSVVLELTRVTCAYQRNFFVFHSQYSKTRSAKALVSCINRSLTDRKLPLAKLLFGQDGLERSHRYADLNEWCFHELTRLQKERKWAIDADDLRPIVRF